MMPYPTDFQDQTLLITADTLGGTANEALQQLSELGYEVHYGLDQKTAQDITQMSLESAIKEYCPKDSAERFADETATAKWLAKGRAAFVLLKKDAAGDLNLAGYGWVGKASSLHVPGGEVTFALRLGEVGQGQGLAEPFTRVMILAAAVLYGAKNIWLETWQSNGAAVHIYHKVGFEDVDQQNAERRKADGAEVADTRIFMSLPNKLLPTS